jgi:signal transduction histidine kinase
MKDSDSSTSLDPVVTPRAISLAMVLASIACIALQLITVTLLVAMSTRATSAAAHAYASWTAIGVALVAMICTAAVLVHWVRCVRREIDAHMQMKNASRRADERREEEAEAKTAELTAWSRHLMRTSEEEKSRIARDLHGTLGSNLTAINMDLNWISKRLPDEPELRDRLQRALKMLTQTVEMKHELIEALRPSHLDNLGLGFAVRTHCREFTQRTGVPCEVKVEEDFDELDPAWSIALYRVMQEALANVAQHARASSVQVLLVREAAGLRLRILDDGAGIPDEFSSQSSLGLVGMRERMREVGGDVQFSSNLSSAGTIVDAFVPFDRVTAQAM